MNVDSKPQVTIDSKLIALNTIVYTVVISELVSDMKIIAFDTTSITW